MIIIAQLEGSRSFVLTEERGTEMIRVSDMMMIE